MIFKKYIKKKRSCSEDWEYVLTIFNPFKITLAAFLTLSVPRRTDILAQVGEAESLWYWGSFQCLLGMQEAPLINERNTEVSLYFKPHEDKFKLQKMSTKFTSLIVSPEAGMISGSHRAYQCAWRMWTRCMHLSLWFCTIIFSIP